MQERELDVTGIPAGLTADSDVSFLVIKTSESMLSNQSIMTGTLLEVLQEVATVFLPFLHEHEKEEREEDGLTPDYDLTTPESCLKEINDRLDMCYEEDLVVFDLTTQTLVYTYTG